MFHNVTLEISGKCNASCQYCISGKNSISGSYQQKHSTFVDFDKFKSAVNYMFEKGIISTHSIIQLFNWGEPFLHPKFKEVFSFLNESKLHYTLSTNASKLVEFEDFDLSNLDRIIFSMPGFSQESYDLVHGFKLERIKMNIEKMLTNYRQNGFVGSAVISFHMYKFNTEELPLALEFAQQLEHLGLTINASGAYLNGYSMFKDYLSGNYSNEKVEVIESQLYTDYYKQFQLQRPNEYICPQFSRLVIDESFNVLSCCSVDKEYYSQALVGNLFEMSLDKLKQRKTSMLICSECQSLGIDYLGHTPVQTMYQLEPANYKLLQVGEDTEIFGGRVYLYGSGDIADTFIYYNKTVLSNKFDIIGVMDSNLSKENTIYNGIAITTPENAKLTAEDMILIASQDKISIYKMMKNLSENFNFDNKILIIVKR